MGNSHIHNMFNAIVKCKIYRTNFYEICTLWSDEETVCFQIIRLLSSAFCRFPTYKTIYFYKKFTSLVFESQVFISFPLRGIQITKILKRIRSSKEFIN